MRSSSCRSPRRSSCWPAASYSSAFRALLVGIKLDLLDPWAWTPGNLALGGVTLLAAIVPARRAARVNPVEVLRAE